MENDISAFLNFAFYTIKQACLVRLYCTVALSRVFGCENSIIEFNSMQFFINGPHSCEITQKYNYLEIIL